MNEDSDLNTDSSYGDFANSDESLDKKSLDNETARLLCELDRAIDHSSALRNIIRRQEALLELESITGCSRKTKTLRQEISRLELQLYTGLGDNDGACDPSLSPA
jgi:hypothetical protein